MSGQSRVGANWNKILVVTCNRESLHTNIPGPVTSNFKKTRVQFDSACYWILYTGRVRFTLDYSFNENSLAVGIVEAQDVPAKDFSGTSDPYARVMLLPDRKKKFDTKVSRIEINFFYYERSEFHKSPCDRTNLTSLPCQVQQEL